MSPVNSPPPFPLPGRYTYGNETLAGGQGAVYICRDANLDRRVAVKALHKIAHPISLLKEIATRGKIKSKHVVEIYDVIVGTKGKLLAIVLEYVPGKTLQDKANIPNDMGGRLRLLYQLACALTEIHAAGVIHRDIKPENVKVNDGGILKVFDLGIANLDADAASTVGAAGTLVYRAPELYSTPPLTVTRAADVYALGVVAWHLLAKGFPAPLLEVPPQHSGTHLPSLDTVAKAALGSSAKVLDRTLDVDPDERPSAAEVREALAAQLNWGRQRGVFCYKQRIWELTEAGKLTSLRVGSLGTIKVAYDGLDFIVREVDKDVYINNVPVAVNVPLPGSCVLTFGEPALGAGRGFVAFNVSQPEIVL
jgi:serine/threonine protein kinase